MTRLKYLDPADGQYKLLPVGGGGAGGPDEVTIGPSAPSSPYTDLWVDTDEPAPVTDWSAGDARYNRAGFRNVIRNGDMSVSQRGNGPWTATGYTADGWRVSFIGGAVSTSRAVQAPGSGPPHLVLAVTGQSGANDYAQYVQQIEDANTLSGQQATVSFRAKAASGTPKLSVQLYQHFGSGGSPSAGVTTAVNLALPISTTLTTYTLPVTVPSVAGKIFGTNNNSSLWLIINVSLGSNSAADGPIGIQNNTFEITDVQLEAGSTASPFERLPVQQQLAWCQRYFQRSEPDSWLCSGYRDPFSSGGWTFVRSLPVIMRAKPVATYSALSTFVIYAGDTGGRVPTLMGPDTISKAVQSIYATTATYPAAGGSAGHSCALYGNPSSYLDLSAEL